MNIEKPAFAGFLLDDANGLIAYRKQKVIRNLFYLFLYQIISNLFHVMKKMLMLYSLGLIVILSLAGCQSKKSPSNLKSYSGQELAPNSQPSASQKLVEKKRVLEPLVTQTPAVHQDAKDQYLAVPETTTPGDKPKLSAELLNQQISQLGENIMLDTREPTKPNNITLIKQNPANKHLAYQYVDDFRLKVERVGMLNFRKAFLKPGVSNAVRLRVGI